MELRPIVSALMRNKAGLVLIVVQVAITLAVLCNSLFIVIERAERVGRHSGMNESDTFTIDSLGFAAGYDARDSRRIDLANLAAMPGVVAVTSTNTTPLSNSGWSSVVGLQPGTDFDTREAGQPSAFYMVDENGLEAFGLRLVEGRNFRSDEVVDMDQNTGLSAGVVIVTSALAKALFPDESILGKQIYGVAEGSRPVTVIGVIEKMQMPWIGANEIEQSTFVPARNNEGGFSRYLIRAEPGQRDRLMPEVEKLLQESNSGRLVRRLRSLEESRQSVYRHDRAMMSILGGTMVAMLVITGLGIVGMTSFWVTRRTKQIGTRRALGARRFDIRRYFQTENAVMIGFGVVLGAVLTYGFNAWLMQNFDMSRLPWHYLPLGALAMFTLGQLAVLGPSARAASVPPALATRTA